VEGIREGRQGMKQRKPWIVCAAIRHDEYLITGPRHFDGIMWRQLAAVLNAEKYLTAPEWEQGFIDQFGTFYNRKDAMLIVKKSGQPFDSERNGAYDAVLYSEGLY
jgi:hypothetical protein